MGNEALIIGLLETSRKLNLLLYYELHLYAYKIYFRDGFLFWIQISNQICSFLVDIEFRFNI